MLKYKTTMTLYNSHFDLNNNLTAKAILEIFQDVASIHGEEIGVGYEVMLAKNLYWVLSRVKFDIIRMPSINEEVIIETWPHQKGRIDFDRDMKISSTSGEILVIGTSKWCVINSNTRMLERTDNINYIGEIFPDINYADRFNKIILPTEEKTFSFTHKVQFSDLDHNQHMNNTNYANLVLNASEDKVFNHFEINFINESKINDEIEVSLVKNESGEYVIGTNNEKTIFVSYIK